jgi:4-diphosphocytidyl-2C-methyl-D-erythritol kinase
MEQLNEVAQIVVDEPDMDSLAKRLAAFIVPLFKAEQAFVAVVAAGEQLTAVSTFKNDHVVAQHLGMLFAKTGIGGTRVITMQIGSQLPRIC